jgi:hypothetical protein
MPDGSFFEGAFFASYEGLIFAAKQHNLSIGKNKFYIVN